MLAPSDNVTKRNAFCCPRLTFEPGEPKSHFGGSQFVLCCTLLKPCECVVADFGRLQRRPGLLASFFFCLVFIANQAPKSSHRHLAKCMAKKRRRLCPWRLCPSVVPRHDSGLAWCRPHR